MKTTLLKPLSAAALSIALAGIFLVRATAQDASQPPHHPGGGHGMHSPLEHIVQDLNLTDAQKTQIDPILKAQEPQIKAIEEQAHKQIEDIVTNVKGQITPYLTPQQVQVLNDQSKLEADRHASGK